MSKKRFIKGALWLTLTAAAMRAVGMGYRVYLSSKLGEEGMGLYQLILSVYMLGSAFAGAGISIAVTRLVSGAVVQGSRRTVNKILRFSLGWSVALGTLVSIVFLGGAGGIAHHLLKAHESAAGLRILGLGLPFMSISAVYNGYFLAVGRVRYSCLAQVAEQAVRIGAVALLIDRYVALGDAAACNIVFVGNTLSEAAAALCLLIFYLKDCRRIPQGEESPDNVYARFLPIQLPIAAGKYISSLLHTGENLLVPVSLEKFSGQRLGALGDFGALKGMALPLIMFPSSFLSSLAGLLIPELTAAATLRRQERIRTLTRTTLTVTFIFSVMMGGLFFRFGEPLGELIYHSESVGNILKWLSPVIPFMYLDCITDGLLKGIGEQMASLRYSTTDSLVRIALVFFWVPRGGLSAFLGIMAISNCSVALLGLRRLIRVTDCTPPIKQGVILPLAGVLTAHFLSVWVSNLLLAATVYMAVFLLFLIGGGVLNKQNLQPFFKP
ncbi:MAG: oligosaccharide flippase family protein [Clostridia bacterium]|nr:oligosaccharide flippase family protein [Clostridia bacterium]